MDPVERAQLERNLQAQIAAEQAEIARIEGHSPVDEAKLKDHQEMLASYQEQLLQLGHGGGPPVD